MFTIQRECIGVIVLSNMVVTQALFYPGHFFGKREGIVYETIGDMLTVKYTDSKHVIIVPTQAILEQIEGETV